MTRPALLLGLSLLTLAACQPEASTATPSDTPVGPDRSEDERAAAARAKILAEQAAAKNKELEDRYRLAISLFDAGAYDEAAAMFTQVFLKLPPDPSADGLRHLMIQHVGWSLLGAYDVSGEAAKLDSGEAILERYLQKHEALRPEAAGEREIIYELLAEYSLRRDGALPPDANERLRALVRETHKNLQRPAPEADPNKANEDRMVREIEVETKDGPRWAKLDDPWVERYLRDPRYAGVELCELPGDPFNPTRVLVRGWIGEAEHRAAKRRALVALRSARPSLEGCYEAALGRGAEISERVEVDLRWESATLAEVELAGQASFDDEAARCVIEALKAAELESSSESEFDGSTHTALHLSFFVQPERSPTRGDHDYDHFGPSQPVRGCMGPPARAEDVSLDSPGGPPF